MSSRDLKKVLQAELKIQEELIEHIFDLYKYIFPRDGISLECAKNSFEEDLESWEYCGCIQPIECLIKRNGKSEG